jgi:hypothetical protein
MVLFTEEAGIVPHLAREEAERRHQYYLAPSTCSSACSSGTRTRWSGAAHPRSEPASRGRQPGGSGVTRARSGLETVRTGIDRLVAEGVLPDPRPSDAELPATLGIDLDAIMGRLDESFGREAYSDAAQNVRLRPARHAARSLTGISPLVRAGQ